MKSLVYFKVFYDAEKYTGKLFEKRSESLDRNEVHRGIGSSRTISYMLLITYNGWKSSEFAGQSWLVDHT